MHVDRMLRLPSEVDRGRTDANKVVFPEWRQPADGPTPQPPAPDAPRHRCGFAVMGLGRLALGEVLPALVAARNAKPTALISGDPKKRKLVASQYGVEHCLDYQDLDQLKEIDDVDAVYIATPNGCHLDDVRIVARSGKHILLEKPMATNAADAEAIARICKDAGVTLMIAYRSQFEPHLVALKGHIEWGTWGKLKAISSINVQTAAASDQWRYDRVRAGGGALPDIGIYCLSVARFLSGEEPDRVYASLRQPTDDPRFHEVEESCTFTLDFPSGLVATSHSSYGAHSEKSLTLLFERATVQVPNAYAYKGVKMVVSRSDKGGETREEIQLGSESQFKLEIEHFADCISKGVEPKLDPADAIRDHNIIEAIYRSAAEGKALPITGL